MNEFYNQPAVNWAKQNLSKSVGIRLRFSSRWGKIFTYLLIFIVPLTFIILGIVLKIIGGGDPLSSTRALACGFVLLIPFGIIALLGVYMQAKFAKSLELDGVKTSFGRKFDWGKLYYVDHVSKRIRHRPIVKDNQLELVFQNGKVIIPPLIHDREQIWNLINSMPVQVRDDGTVREIQSAGNVGENKGAISMDEILKMIESLPPSEKNNQ